MGFSSTAHTCRADAIRISSYVTHTHAVHMPCASAASSHVCACRAHAVRMPCCRARVMPCTRLGHGAGPYDGVVGSRVGHERLEHLGVALELEVVRHLRPRQDALSRCEISLAGVLIRKTRGRLVCRHSPSIASVSASSPPQTTYPNLVPNEASPRPRRARRGAPAARSSRVPGHSRSQQPRLLKLPEPSCCRVKVPCIC